MDKIVYSNLLNLQQLINALSPIFQRINKKYLFFFPSNKLRIDLNIICLPGSTLRMKLLAASF